MTAPAVRRLPGLDPLSRSPDRDLLRRYADAGDPEAFAELVRRLGPLVLGVCRRALGPGPDADDAFQATFLVLARDAGRVRDGAALPGWVHRVAVRAAGKARARRRPVAPGPDVASPADPFAEAAWRDVRRVLDAELDRLPDRYRGPVVLCLVDGLTRDEAAGRLGYSLNTLKRRLDAGRDLLRARLTRRGLGPAVAAAGVLTGGGLRAGVPDGLAAAAAGLGEPAGRAAVAPGVASLAAAAGRGARGGWVWAAGVAVVAAVGVAAAVGPLDPPAAPDRPARADPAPGKPGPPPPFFVWPVRTDLQRRLLLPHTADAYVLLDATPGMAAGRANVRGLPLDDLRTALAPYKKDGPPVLVTLVFTEQARSEDPVGPPDTLRLAVSGDLHESGFARVRSVITSGPNLKEWREVVAGHDLTTGRPDGPESAVGDDPATAYPVATPLSRFLTSGADCVVAVGPKLTEAEPVVPQAVREAAVAAVAKLNPARRRNLTVVIQYPDNRDKGQLVINALYQFGTDLGFAATTVTMK